MFQLISPFKITLAQKEAAEKLVSGVKKGYKHQTLLGVTGCGKTFVMANVINEVQLPILVLSPNKTLAAQLYEEFKSFFQKMLSIILFTIMITISPKPISLKLIPILKKTLK